MRTMRRGSDASVASINAVRSEAQDFRRFEVRISGRQHEERGTIGPEYRIVEFTGRGAAHIEQPGFVIECQQVRNVPFRHVAVDQDDFAIALERQASARLMLVNVLPSPGTALVTTMILLSFCTPSPDIDFSSGRLTILYSSASRRSSLFGPDHAISPHCSEVDRHRAIAAARHRLDCIDRSNALWVSTRRSAGC